MSKKRICIAVLSICAIIAGIICIISSWRGTPDRIYYGEEVFYSSSEYQEFKEYVLQPNVSIEKIEMLASAPPIWVRYSISIPKDWKFLYSYSHSESEINENLLLAGMLCTAGGIVGVWVSEPEKKARTKLGNGNEGK